MTELQNGSQINDMLNNPDEMHDYFFELNPNERVTITFVAPSLEYKLLHVKEAYPLPKGGTVNGHSGGPVDFTTSEEIVFTESTKHRIYLTIASADGVTLPSDGYTISMSVAA